jgi:ABC-type phosphate transport system substrate-binding protein
MKTFILRASTFATAAALSGMIACGSSSSCGGTTANPTTTAPTQTTGVTCGEGTTQVQTASGPQCQLVSSH